MLVNKYSKWYNNICNNAQKRNWTKKNSPCYVENHHIIPKCINGSNFKQNLVCLTAKEHFICHLLLTKCYDGDTKYKMIYALHMLCHMHTKKQSRYRITSQIFINLRIPLSLPKTQSHKQSISNALKGKKKSKEHCQNLQTALLNSPKFKGKNNAFYGKIHSDETKQKIRNKITGNKLSQETKEKMRQAKLAYWATKRSL